MVFFKKETVEKTRVAGDMGGDLGVEGWRGRERRTQGRSCQWRWGVILLAQSYDRSVAADPAASHTPSLKKGRRRDSNLGRLLLSLAS